MLPEIGSGDHSSPAACGAAFSFCTEVSVAISLIGKVMDLDKHVLTCHCLGKCVRHV